MPIYEYTCDNCGERTEKLQRLNDEPLKKCEACGKPKLRKQTFPSRIATIDTYSPMHPRKGRGKGGWPR